MNYVASVSGLGVGDSLAYAWVDLQAEKLGVVQHWCAWMDKSVNPYLHTGWFNAPLFHLYQQAGIFSRLAVMSWENPKQYQQDRSYGLDTLSNYFNITYGTQGEWEKRVHPQISGDWFVKPFVKEMRSRFAFLLQRMKPYGSIHFSSSSFMYSQRNPGLADTKRASIPAVLDELQTTSLKHFKMIGSLKDRPMVQAAISKLKKERPDCVFEDCTGMSILSTFSLLYNTQLHIAGETGTPFFTAQLGIPSVKIFLNEASRIAQAAPAPPYPSARNNWEPYWKNIKCLKMVTDPVQVIYTHHKDLV